jgi:hypothetical protein
MNYQHNNNSKYSCYSNFSSFINNNSNLPILYPVLSTEIPPLFLNISPTRKVNYTQPVSRYVSEQKNCFPYSTLNKLSSCNY